MPLETISTRLRHRVAGHRGPRNNCSECVQPPPSELYTTSLPSVHMPAIYVGDFNCQHTGWGHKHTTKDGEMLGDWASSAEAVLPYGPKEPPSFFSARWNTYKNPDLAFTMGRICDQKLERRIIIDFLGHRFCRLLSKCHRWFSR